MSNKSIIGDIIRPFSPAIGKYIIDIDLIKTINKHVDAVLKDEDKIQDSYHGDKLAGEIKYEIKLSNEFISLGKRFILANFLLQIEQLHYHEQLLKDQYQ